MAAMIGLLVQVTSCLKDAPESLPDRIQWDPELAFPLGEDRFGLFDVPGFDSSKLDLDTITGLPEWLDQVVVSMEGVLDFGLSSIQENLEHINGVLFRVNAFNGFPDEIFAQAFFRDEGGNDIDSMFMEGPLPVPPAVIREDGEIISTGQASRDAYFDRNRIEGLENATAIFLRAYFIVTDPDSALIPLYPAFEFNVHMGAMLDLTMEF
jgi:hypothetical protein